MNLSSCVLSVTFCRTSTDFLKIPDKPRWLLRLALFSLPLPWIASEAGWFVAEYGRQPWAIGEILPTSLAVSSLTAGEVLGTLAAIVVLYSIFLIIEVWLMVRFARKGPSSLHTGRYDLETGKLKEA